MAIIYHGNSQLQICQCSLNEHAVETDPLAYTFTDSYLGEWPSITYVFEDNHYLTIYLCSDEQSDLNTIYINSSLYPDMWMEIQGPAVSTYSTGESQDEPDFKPSISAPIPACGCEFSKSLANSDAAADYMSDIWLFELVSEEMYNVIQEGLSEGSMEPVHQAFCEEHRLRYHIKFSQNSTEVEYITPFKIYDGRVHKESITNTWSLVKTIDPQDGKFYMVFNNETEYNLILTFDDAKISDAYLDFGIEVPGGEDYYSVSMNQLQGKSGILYPGMNEILIGDGYDEISSAFDPFYIKEINGGSLPFLISCPQLTGEDEFSGDL